MKVVGIIGYKKSGKTTLLVNLARELKKRGYKVSTVKHTLGGFDLSDKDTGKHKEYISEAAAISPYESILFLKGKKNLEDILSYISADFVLVEGFKSEKTFPKIVCLREKKEASQLFDGLQICAAMLSPADVNLEVPMFKISTDSKKVADLVCEKAFKLPNLDCGGCGYESCFELAKEIVKGRKSIKDCSSLNSPIGVMVNGKSLALNPFVTKVIQGSIEGMLSPLKGFRKGEIEIKISI
ncbi:MAG: molybdopterin-guanine dinucleotide biosynthesis protein B [Candidatus Aerophobetes bacterium]|nr:molybdopterin-guanine dinucleotide biosynthesis protein B [Candidatus Aerophobetes bacterium]